MNKLVVALSITLIALTVAVLVYVFKPRPVEDTISPAEIKAMPFKRVFDMALQCEEEQLEENCTLIMEVNALKAQHAKQGERFWIRQMLRLGDWYTYVGTKDYRPGEPKRAEIDKAVELYDWLLSNKPFYNEQVLISKARLYDSPHNTDWASAHRDEAVTLYRRVQEQFPDTEYAAEATAALDRLL